MLNTVRRQQDLRLRLLHAAYNAMLENPDGYMQPSSLSVPSTNDTPIPTTEEGDPPRPKIDFVAHPPTPLEVKAATYYLAERGYFSLMPSELMQANNLDPKEVYARITASGTEVFEGLVLSANTKVERQIGFVMASPNIAAERPRTPIPSVNPPALPETMELG